MDDGREITGGGNLHYEGWMNEIVQMEVEDLVVLGYNESLRASGVRLRYRIGSCQDWRLQTRDIGNFVKQEICFYVLENFKF